MPINPAIEEKAKAFTNNTPTTETDAEFLQRSYEFAQDIYQLGVSDGEKKVEKILRRAGYHHLATDLLSTLTKTP